MKKIAKLKIIYDLKEVFRASLTNKNRYESSAEHSWSSLILADFLLNYTSKKLDRLKVFELIMYHDLVEVYAGDVKLTPLKEYCEKKKKVAEKKAFLKLEKELPKEISKKYSLLYEEYESLNSLEAKFAKAVDVLDPMVQELKNKSWKGWTRDFLIEKKLKYFKEFPEIEKLFYEFLEYLVENKYIEK